MSVASEPDAAHRRGQYASKMREAYPENYTLREASSALNRFYTTSENIPIEMSVALTIIAMRAVGVDESKIDSATTTARRNGAPGAASWK